MLQGATNRATECLQHFLLELMNGDCFSHRYILMPWQWWTIAQIVPRNDTSPPDQFTATRIVLLKAAASLSWGKTENTRKGHRSRCLTDQRNVCMLKGKTIAKEIRSQLLCFPREYKWRRGHVAVQRRMDSQPRALCYALSVGKWTELVTF